MMAADVLARVEALFDFEGIPTPLGLQVAIELFADLRPRDRQILVDTKVAGTEIDWELAVAHVRNAIERADQAVTQRRRRHEKGSF